MSTPLLIRHGIRRSFDASVFDDGVSARSAAKDSSRFSSGFIGSMNLAGERVRIRNTERAAIKRQAGGVGQPYAAPRLGVAAPVVPDGDLLGSDGRLDDGNQHGPVLRDGDGRGELVLEQVAEFARLGSGFQCIARSRDLRRRRLGRRRRWGCGEFPRTVGNLGGTGVERRCLGRNVDGLSGAADLQVRVTDREIGRGRTTPSITDLWNPGDSISTRSGPLGRAANE